MIKKDILAQIILDFQTGQLPELIDRQLTVNLKIPIKRAVTIVGPRRCGKTYYLFSLIKKLLSQGIDKDRILYVNFEQPKLAGMDLADLELLVEVYYEIYPANRNRKVWFFFDEIQNIKFWEKFIRNLLDQGGQYIFITGSSSKMLSREIATSLRGRTLSYLILPFSFQEFLNFKQVDYSGKYLSSAQTGKIVGNFKEYFNFGAYPEAMSYPQEREKIINEIIETTIYQDLIERHEIRNIKLVKLMFNYLVEAKEFSVHRFYNFLKSINVKVSKNSLYNYLEFFNDAFIFFPVRNFSWKTKNLEQSIAKIYTVDNGLIENIVGDNKGKKFENLVFISLLQQGWPAKQIFYYSLVNGEVDFIIKDKKKIIQIIQACWEIENHQTRDREIKSLLKAADQLKCDNLLILTNNYQAKQKVKDKTIIFMPLWKWLLK